MLTARSNFILEEDDHEGLHELPLESPLDTDKIV